MILVGIVNPAIRNKNPRQQKEVEAKASRKLNLIFWMIRKQRKQHSHSNNKNNK